MLRSDLIIQHDQHRPFSTHLGMDTAGLAHQSFEIRCRGSSLGYINRLQPLDGGHGAHSALDLDLSMVHHRLRDVCLGRLDSAEFRHAGQLPVAGHHRHSGPCQDVVSMI